MPKREPQAGDLRMLQFDRKIYPAGELVIVPAGTLVEVGVVFRDSESKRPIQLLVPEYNYAWFVSLATYKRTTGRPVKPKDPFKDERSFRVALAYDREATIRALMERKLAEWQEEGDEEVARCLTCWAMHGLNLGSSSILLELAESQWADGEADDDETDD